MERGILFLCTGNSCRSQIAEGLGRHYLGPEVAVYSAGTRPSSIHPLAVRVMDELNIDIRGQASKHLRDIPMERVFRVVTLCDSAALECPTGFGKEVLHWDLSDPALAEGDEGERLKVFREIRDSIGERVQALAKTV